MTLLKDSGKQIRYLILTNEIIKTSTFNESIALFHLVHNSPESEQKLFEHLRREVVPRRFFGFLAILQVRPMEIALLEI